MIPREGPYHVVLGLGWTVRRIDRGGILDPREFACADQYSANGLCAVLNDLEARLATLDANSAALSERLERLESDLRFIR
jgi:uncharacterized protein YceH (UPF0502 family)